MRIIMAAAVSKDGFITKDGTNNVTEWTSKEDQEFFNLLRKSHPLFVMGSGTYDNVQPKPSSAVLRVVLTSKPDNYKQAVMGQLEFHNLTPMEFVLKYQDKFESCLLLGGSQLYEEFLKNELVDEVILTVEPDNNVSGTTLLKSGSPLSKYIKSEPKTSILNKKGTLLKHYVL